MHTRHVKRFLCCLVHMQRSHPNIFHSVLREFGPPPEKIKPYLTFGQLIPNSMLINDWVARLPFNWPFFKKSSKEQQGNQGATLSRH